MRGYRTFDWRFWVALTACLMVAYLVIGGYQDNVAKGKRIDHLISDAREADANQEAANKRASAERRSLLRNQDRLLHLYRVQVRRQAALLAYLDAQGIQVPDEFRTGNLPGRRRSSRPQTENLPGKPGKGQGQGTPPSNPPEAPPDPLSNLADFLADLLPKGVL